MTLGANEVLLCVSQPYSCTSKVRVKRNGRGKSFVLEMFYAHIYRMIC